MTNIYLLYLKFKILLSGFAHCTINQVKSKRSHHTCPVVVKVLDYHQQNQINRHQFLMDLIISMSKRAVEVLLLCAKIQNKQGQSYFLI